MQNDCRQKIDLRRSSSQTAKIPSGSRVNSAVTSLQGGMLLQEVDTDRYIGPLILSADMQIFTGIFTNILVCFSLYNCASTQFVSNSSWLSKNLRILLKFVQQIFFEFEIKSTKDKNKVNNKIWTFFSKIFLRSCPFGLIIPSLLS